MSKGFDILLESLLQISLTTAVVIAILLMLIPVWRQRYSARWRKVIWLVITVRLLVPFSIELPAAPVQMSVDWQHEVMGTVPEESMNDPMKLDEQNAAAQNDTAILPKENTTPLMEQQAAANGLAVFDEILYRDTVWLAVWLVGALLFVLWHGGNYAVFRRKVMRFAVPFADTEGVLQQAAQDFSIRRYPAVVMSRNAQGPMLIGFCKPVIVLPERNYDAQELALILRHELVHYKQHDLWYKLLLLAANAVHWFNPMVWLMVRQANKDIEQVCDDIVVAGKDMDYRKAYSMTLLNAMASQRGVALSTYLSKDAQNAKTRFAAILQPKQYKKGIALLCIITLSAVGISGCLQLNPLTGSKKTAEQIQPYLPEQYVLSDMTLTTDSIMLAEPQTRYIWKVIDPNRGEWNPISVNAIVDQDGTLTELQAYISGVQISDSKEFLMPDDIAKTLAEEFLLEVTGERNLKLRSWEPHEGMIMDYSTYKEDTTIGWLADSKEDGYYYDVVVNKSTRSIESYRKCYDNVPLREQMQTELKAIGDSLYEPYGNILGTAVYYNGESYLEDDKYTALMIFNIFYDGADTERDPEKIWAEKEHTEKYPQVFGREDRFETSLYRNLRVTAPLKADGTLDMSRCYLEYNDNYPMDTWQELSDLSVFIGMTNNAIQKVSIANLDIIDAATQFALDYVSAAGQGGNFETLPSTPLPEYEYENMTWQNVYDKVHKAFREEYGQFGNNREDLEPVKITIGLLTDDDSMDYLTMKLEELDHIEGAWVVTETWLEK